MPCAAGAYARHVADTQRMRKTPRLAQVRQATWLDQHFRRIVLGGPGLTDFPEPPAADAYLKLILQNPNVEFRAELDLAAARRELPEAHWPRVRAYTIRDWSASSQELTVDILVHRRHGQPCGPGSTWAAQAQTGDFVHLTGPGGNFQPNSNLDWQLYLGDLSAWPAISVAAATTPAAQRWIFVERDHPQPPVANPENVAVHWLYRKDTPPGTTILAALTDLPRPAGTGQAFIHGEAGWVRQARKIVRQHWNLPLADLSASGYWRQGVTDENWRASKAEWTQSLDR